jgi:glycosyltransferase involved in cell wall biosynthesis
MKLAVPRPSIGKALAAFQPELIHVAQPVVLGGSALYYSRARRVPLVISYHAQVDRYLHYYGLGLLEPILWAGTKSVYNNADLVLVTSRAMQNLLQKHGIRRIQLWQRGVDTETFHPRQASPEMRARLTRGHPEGNLLLYVGRLSAEKGLEDIRPVLDALPGVRLALVGDGPHRAKLEQHFAGTPTHFAGYLQGAELAAAYASADVFFMPSCTETLGLVLLEAMAAGCPVVAVAEGGIVDIVRDGVTGHLWRHGDQAGAISAVRQLLSDPTHRENMRREARLDAEKWSWAAATRQLQGFYRHVMTREQEVSRLIAQHGMPWASREHLCEALQISRATFRRHTRLQAGSAGS